MPDRVLLYPSAEFFKIRAKKIPAVRNRDFFRQEEPLFIVFVGISFVLAAENPHELQPHFKKNHEGHCQQELRQHVGRRKDGREHKGADNEVRPSPPEFLVTPEFVT